MKCANFMTHQFLKYIAVPKEKKCDGASVTKEQNISKVSLTVEESSLPSSELHFT